jgi:hypothetical protein
MGVLLGFDKVYAFLPGYVLSNVFAHAHAAVLGWAAMLVVGLGYRLLPMVLPSAMPSGRSILLSAILLETGTLGLFAALVMGSRWTALFALVILAAFICFGAHVWWMLRHPPRTAVRETRSDFALHHLVAAGTCLLLACACGIGLAIAAPSEMSMHVALLYGVLGLLGFLAQVITAFERRILPTVAIYWVIDHYGGPFQAAASSGAVSGSILAGWVAGVPLVAVGLFATNVVMLTVGSWLLLGAVLLSAVDLAGSLAMLRKRVPTPGADPC